MDCLSALADSLAIASAVKVEERCALSLDSVVYDTEKSGAEEAR